MKTKFIEFLRDEEGATAIEYALIAALIAVAAITVMGLVGGGVTEVFQQIVDKLPAGDGGG